MSDSTISPSKSSSHSRRQLRERKQRKLYAEEYALGDDDTEGIRGFSVAEKLESDKFAQSGMVREMKGADLTIAYFQQFCFNIPLLFKDKAGLGLSVPVSTFSINDVRMCVGSKRKLDVMDVNTQKNLTMTMKEWQEYYESPAKNRLLNVISLEFSHTKLDHYVQSPYIVRMCDWVDVVWPKQLKDEQVEGTNALHEMRYPKVQKYCLMSVKNCYTDFHVDFGGTSVWYHILRGSKVFWLIPPTERNLTLYERWVLSGKQSDIFFGDTVDKCVRVYLTAGNTFFIPTGWIHAVYTPTDSLVFGGNFLHSFGILKQLKIAMVEDATKVPQKFRYPFFTEMQWYVLARYVHRLLGRAHLEGMENREEEAAANHVHMTNQELYGLKEIVMYLYGLPQHKKSVPVLIKDAVSLIKDIRIVVEKHCKDDPMHAVTGEPILHPNCNQSPKRPTVIASTAQADASLQSNGDPSTPPNAATGQATSVIATAPNAVAVSPNEHFVSPQSVTPGRTGPRGPYKKHKDNSVNGTPPEPKQNGSGPPRRRRTRCKTCSACQRNDCGECSFCMDMVKFGGPGRAKQTCTMRQCLQPMLPVTAQCVICHLDGWRQTPVTPQAKMQASLEGPSSLMECSVCYEIAHADCLQKAYAGDSESGVGESEIAGVVNEDLPNSWECPSCCSTGKNSDYKPRHFRARQKSSEVRRPSVSSDASPNVSAELKSTQLQPPATIAAASGSPNSTPMETTNTFTDSESDSKKIPLAIKQEISNDVPATKAIIGKKKASTQVKYEEQSPTNPKRRKSDDGSSVHESADITPEHIPATSRKNKSLRAQLANQIVSSTTKSLKKPSHAVRPANSSNTSTQIGMHSLDAECLLAIFRHLPQESLIACSMVCKSWSTISVDPRLWKRMNCAHLKLSASLLTGIVRRQPEHLILDWTLLAKQQLSWLISKIPALKNLSLQGTPLLAVVGLHTCLCPPLQVLDLSFVRSLNDSAVRDILSPPKDSRPGLSDSKSRLRNLKQLKLAGTDISDVALRYITQGIPSLVHLDLSSCQRVTDAGVAQIGTCQSAINCLVELDLSSCRLVTESCLEYLSKCEALTFLDLRHVPLVSTQAVIRFASRSKHNLQVRDVKLVDKRRPT